MIIYKISHINNESKEMIYIGQGENLPSRQKGYKNEIKRVLSGKRNARPIIKAMIEYGYETFSWTIIEGNVLDQKTLDNKEIFWIAELNCLDKEVGYNKAIGGNCGSRGIKLEGEKLEKARNSISIANKTSADLSRGKPATGIKLITTLENVKKAQIASAIARTGKPSPKRIQFTPEQLEEIRQDTGSCIKVGKKYGVSAITISRIRSRKRQFKDM